MKFENFDIDQETGQGKASGNVVWMDTLQQLGVRADKIDFAKSPESMLAYGDKRSLFYVVIEQDTLFMGSDTLYMWSEPDSTGSSDSVRMFSAYHDVRLYKSDLQGHADSLVFHGHDSLFILYGKPILWSDTTQFSADSIEMSMANKQIEDITLTRNALIISEILGVYYDQIKGRTIVASFEENTVEDMWVTGNAESIYYTRDDDNAFIGVNKTICSKMYFTFQEGQIHQLKYYGDNSSSMMPMHEADHGSLRLEGFQWRPEERPMTVSDLLK